MAGESAEDSLRLPAVSSNTMPEEGTDTNSAKSVTIDPEREIRFAVVMYGGVSLAIYINGVAQELLNMVRATAPDRGAPSNPRRREPATASVYQELARYLDQRDGFNGNDGVIHTRFVVDVISGTSAGGINGVFLAKALARDQSMDGLKKLWLSEGDLNKLLNDSVSVSDLAGFAVQKPQQSLLNSQRMYRKLLEALEQMAIRDTGEFEGKQEEDEREKTPSPLVSELDLFLTTTDLEGLPLPISLADKVVYERRYRNVFHFRYDSTPDGQGGVRRDDFKRATDPFLAYAARCTSSFPFAFEPMRLGDILAVTRAHPRYSDVPTLDDDSWDPFFSEYLLLGLYDINRRAREEPGVGLTEFPGKQNEKIKRATAKLREGFWSRAFGDGGYLDNKPFSYATSRLMRRQSDVVYVERKLLYVEPSPEHPELAPENRERPDFAENVRAALLELPRQETIREDIERIYERNQTIARLTTYTRELDSDVAKLDLKTINGAKFAAADLDEMIREYNYGPSYGAYHRLRVGEVTTFLAATVARAKGHDPASDAADAIREVIAAWRDKNYKPNKQDPDDNHGRQRAPENRFLVDFDAHYRLRRVIFLIRRINDLAQYARSNKLDLLERLKRMLGSSFKAIKQQHEAKHISEQLDARLYSAINGWLHAKDPATAEARVWLDAFVTELQRIKKTVLSKALESIRAFLEAPLALSDPGVIDLLRKFELTWQEMKEILDAKGALRSPKVSDEDIAAFKPLAETISSQFVARVPFVLVDAIRDCASISPGPASSKVRDPAEQNLRQQGELAARLWLIDCAENFARYDMISLPIEYGTGAGEANTVDVFRISPEDATSLIDERRAGEERRKLAGTALMSFGAFLDRGWRKNDMLWGRLDGAERLIMALLPKKSDNEHKNEKPTQKDKREELIRSAQIGILQEEIRESDVRTLQSLLSNLLARVEPASVEERRLREVVEAALAGQKRLLPDAFRSTLREVLSKPEELHDYYQKHYEVNRQFEAETAARLIARATNITGQMLEAVANKCAIDPAKRAAEWIARFGGMFWNLVAVAVPNSLGNIFVRHWLGLLYLFSVVALTLGIVMPTGSPMRTVGWQMLGVTITLNLIVFLVGDFIAGSRRWLRALGTMLVLLIAALLAVGAYALWTEVLNYLHAHPQLLPPAASSAVTNVDARLPAAVVASAILLLFVCKEWLKGLRTFQAAPHWSFNMRRLCWLTVLTAVMCSWVSWTSRNIPMLELEFGVLRSPPVSDALIKVRRALFIDYLFILLYVPTYVCYCIAAAKLFWRHIDAIEERRWQQQVEEQNQEQADEPEQQCTQDTQAGRRSWSRLLQPFQKIRQQPPLRKISRILVAIGFFLAAAQCIAGLADIAENSVLLWYLAGHGDHAYLQMSQIFATIKFLLIAAGLFYSFWGFFSGISQTVPLRVILLSGVFAGLSAIGAGFALWALVTHPQLFQQLWPSVQFLMLG